MQQLTQQPLETAVQKKQAAEQKIADLEQRIADAERQKLETQAALQQQRSRIDELSTETHHLNQDLGEARMALKAALDAMSQEERKLLESVEARREALLRRAEKAQKLLLEYSRELLAIADAHDELAADYRRVYPGGEPLCVDGVNGIRTASQLVSTPVPALTNDRRILMVPLGHAKTIRVNLVEGL